MGGTLSKSKDKIRSTARGQLTGEFIRRLAEDFNLYGPDVIEKLRTEQPGKYVEAISKLVPAELLISHDNDVAELEGMNANQIFDYLEEQLKLIRNEQRTLAITDQAAKA
jgi:hypothetical protein